MSDENNCKCGSGFSKDMPLPEVNFSTFVMSLSSSALVHLGEIPDPSTGKVEFTPVIAKQSIDILAVLQDKIKNGMNPEEEKLLCDLLYNLRMKYVAKTK
ncbi:DUF1844 domain-containing protein [Maridesulfovibrio ferrireducens]|uniref:DUF1844 domain-containing protein n=1 Tax=Maridesulfovibrio ferrireducens TaxID=246191 RepID=UPI001A251B4F|nr:DUF1844 domain-containing protein [Maridesulfovibrio ferrireducens]MBI9111845.1 DUF1844 domain-containing protein [Maridesulfovibrio ferrireducens]